MDALERLGLALAIGFLVGVERGWRARDVAEGGRTAGIRTYALTGLLGGVSGLLGQAFGGWALAAIGLPFAAAFIWFKQKEQAEEDDHSVTAVVAALLVFALGAYAIVGEPRVAAAASVAVTLLLAFKNLLHGWLKRLTWVELRSALILLAMSFIALPLLPDRGFGPYGSINPYELWLLTIAMAGISFVAYAAIRALGPARGTLVASVAGALVSSTAVTAYLARLQGGAPDMRAYLAGALLAGAVMAGRIGVIVLALSPPLLQRLVYPLGAFLAVSTVLGLALAWRSRPMAKGEGAESPLKSPFDLLVVLKLALMLGAVMAGARILSAIYGSGALLAVAAFAGLADVDAVTLATAKMAVGGLDLGLAAQAILLAAAVDSLSKIALATAFGGPRFGALFGGGTLLAAAAAAAAYWL